MNEILCFIFWFAGVFFVSVVALTILEFAYKTLTSFFSAPLFDIQKFKTEVLKYIKFDTLANDVSVVESVCDIMMKKFPGIENIVYIINDDASSVDFTVITKDLRKYNIQITKD